MLNIIGGKSMLFSMIVPIYKVEKYLVKCVESLINQTFVDIEIILVDDGSPDKCPQICDKYAKQDSRIKVIHKTNGGLSDARNVGIINAEGEYIIFVDSDDYIDKDACERIALYVKQQPDVIVTDGIVEGGTSNLLHYKVLIGKEYLGIDYIKESIINGNLPMAAWLYIYRKSFLIDNHLLFKKGIFHEDEQFTPRALLKAKKVIYSDIAHYHYVLRENSIMTSSDKRKNAIDLFNTCLELEEEYNKISDNILKDYLLDSLVNKYLSLYQMGALYKYGEDFIHKEFIRKNAKLTKTKFKACLLCFSPVLYWYVNDISKKMFRG